MTTFHSERELKISEAISACLDRCIGTEMIFGRIEEFLDDLRRQEGWREADVRLVEWGVRHILSAILESPIASQVRS